VNSTAKPGLALVLTNPRGEPLLSGPFTKLRFDGRQLFVEPGGLMAKHADHRWELTTGHRYSRLECDHRLEVCFESLDGTSSKTLGPFDSFAAVDGILYADYRIIAFCDEQNKDWYSYDLGSHWKAIVIRPVVSDMDKRL
jgi:hypothetical protein